jgi:hypothetical protein
MNSYLQSRHSIPPFYSEMNTQKHNLDTLMSLRRSLMQGKNQDVVTLRYHKPHSSGEVEVVKDID